MSEVYTFSLGAKEIIYDSDTSPITRDEINKEFDNEEANISMPLDLFPATEFRVFNPATTVWCKIVKNGVMIFYGRVAGCSFDIDAGIAKLKLITLKGMLKSKIPSRTYSRSCPFEIFSKDCKLKREDFALYLFEHDIKLDESRFKLTSPKIEAFKSGYFALGYIEFGEAKSHIVAHNDDTLELLFPIPNAFNGIIKVYPGCDKRIDTCETKFNNLVNYGGFAFVPAKNPVTEGF
ncbi:TPA: phage BR0599 family protein [Campylobacter fetus subsp. venerealis]|uniref:Phage protein n=1 Tax=Campylobacter fetus subsp. venerealis NCTC 10354 TaxID=983328 RepID=A0AAE6IXS8_CAMFE|nr:phage BR0599 family protein [Campylobacter fetus]OCS25429.1 hypothetical protein CFVB10_08505 [Campylobacter fetus subsp. venerealis cfvB10]OCS29094.1 hypothetical protein CFVCCUG33900_08315 [Campylobacter fetus subsp. venerealis LMG 6570 = CCUG 33900]AIR80132.1 putative phage protein [Campylobacter fetus subsp. venerealis 97/608]EAK0836127.1 hypothetical protein [Campylobacter fetus]EGU23656.1 Hypothetical protein CFV354_0572 [Campylobacter fetus subsp. venerealis NCTC 10354]